MAQELDQPRLITTKLEPPALPRRAVARPRIEKALSIAGERPFTLVTGPPGVGKTVAVVQWLDAGGAGTPAAWLSLDPDDDSPLRFWRYLVGTFSHAGIADLGETLAVSLESGGTSDDVAASFVSEVQELREPAVLVLDDLHVIGSAEILRQLEIVIERLPSTLRIIGASRSDPPFPLASWRAKERLGEVRHADLAFRSDEVADYLAAFGGLRLSDRDVEHVAARTEGWAAAIQMIALAARDARDPHEAIRAVTGQDVAIASFLADELLERQPSEVRRFLLETSILTVMDAPICDAVTGRTDARQMLRRLEAANLFTVRLRRRELYRYHQLFAEVLTVELEAEDPDGTRRQDLHRRAAGHLAERGDVAGRVHHLVAAGDHDAAFQVAVAPAMRLWDRGETDPAALEWLDLFPAAFVEEDPSRIVSYLVALGAASKWERIAAWLPLADQRCPPLDVGAIRMVLELVRGDGTAALAIAARLPALDGRVAATAEPQLRSRVGLSAARAHLLVDDPDGARDALDRIAGDDATAAGVVEPALRSRVAYRVGALDRAVQLAEEAVLTADELGIPGHFSLIEAGLARAGAHLERNRLADAASELERVLDAAEQRRAPGYQVQALVLQARVAAARRGPADGLAVIGLARHTFERRCRGEDLSRLLAAVEVGMCCDAGDVERARGLLSGMPFGPARTLAAARVLLVGGEPVAALETLAGATFTNVRDQLLARLLRARVELALDGSAHGSIESAVAIAAPEGFVRPFLDEGVEVARRSHAVAAASADPRVRSLAGSLAASGLEERDPCLSEPLTSREHQVLRYLPRPLTNDEIAAELFVSLNTVKTHLKGVYRKLGVTSRAEAVARARALNLF